MVNLTNFSFLYDIGHSPPIRAIAFGQIRCIVATTHCYPMTTHHACTRTLRSAKLALRDRYQLNSRKSLYRRLNGLGIQLAKKGNKSYATEEQIALLDQQNEHIKQGGTIDNFEPVKIAEVTVHDSATQHNGNNGVSSLVETQLHSTQLQITPELGPSVVMERERTLSPNLLSNNR